MTNKIEISGIAVRAGISRNKRKYLASELEKFAPTLQGKPILKDHEGFTDNVIGRVTETSFNKEDGSVSYKGWIKEDGTGIVEKIKDKRISEVSIGAIAGKVVKEKKDDEIVIPIDLDAMELSTTPVPGVKGTSLNIESKELDLTENSIKKIIEDYNLSSSDEIQNNNKKEDMKMSEKINNDSNVVEQMQKESLQMKEKFEALTKANESLEKEKSEMLESQRLSAIESYKTLCESKKVSAKDLSKASMEMITFATETVDELPEPKEEDKEKETKEDTKEDAEPKSQEPKEGEEDESKEFLKGYSLTREDVTTGFALFKYY